MEMCWGWRLRGCSMQKWGKVTSGRAKWDEHWREGFLFIYLFLNTAGQIIVWKQQRRARKMRPLPSEPKACEVWKNWTKSVWESYQGSRGFEKGEGDSYISGKSEERKNVTKRLRIYESQLMMKGEFWKDSGKKNPGR